MNKISLLGLSMAFAALGSAQSVITEWNFNGPSTGEVPGGTSSPTPSTGSGTASLLGVTASFASGAATGGSSDPATGAPPNYAWNTTTYAAQGNESGQRGVMFQVATTGFTGINISFDLRHSNTSSRWMRFDYATNAAGDNWVLGTAAAGTVWEASAGGDAWYNNRGIDLAGVSAVENNPDFRFRFVSIFGPAAGPFDDGTTYTQYFAATGTSTYAGTGTLRYDMVTVEGVPEPATMTALALGALGVLARRRRA